MYKPLPYNLTIKDSSIHGLGVFAVFDIEENSDLGMIHYHIDDAEIIRTPLGGFINHSDTPNCLKITKKTLVGKRSYLVTDRDIKCGEELTIKYDLYKV